MIYTMVIKLKYILRYKGRNNDNSILAKKQGYETTLNS